MSERGDFRPILKFDVDRLTLPYRWCASCGLSVKSDDDEILRGHVRFSDTCTSIVEVKLNLLTAQQYADEQRDLPVASEHLLAAIATPVQIRAGRLEVVPNVEFMRAVHALIARAGSRQRQDRSED